MFAPGGREDQVAGLKWVARESVEENSGAARDDVNLIARVWRLRVVATWRVHFDLQTAVFEQRDGSHPVNRVQLSQRVFDMNVRPIAARLSGRGVSDSAVSRSYFFHRNSPEISFA